MCHVSRAFEEASGDGLTLVRLWRSIIKDARRENHILKGNISPTILHISNLQKVPNENNNSRCGHACECIFCRLN